MFTHYFNTACRAFLRHKLYSLINILGLAIGLGVFILIFLYVEKEFSWDRQWDNADRIYWLTLERNRNSVNANKGPFAPVPMKDLIAQQFPESIEQSAQLIFNNGEIIVDDQRYPGNILLAERSFLDIFDLDHLSGSFEETFAGTGRIALEDRMARQYFGDTDPLGKTITLAMGEQGRTDFRVTAVFKAPEESSLFMSSLSLLDDTNRPGAAVENNAWWTMGYGVIYYVLRPGADVDDMNRRLEELVNSVIPKEPWRIMQPEDQLGDIYKFEFEHLAEAHFSNYLGASTVDKNKVLVFALIGVLVLFMGSANYVILATAKAEDQRREVGIHKVLGANRRQLMCRFLGESLLQACAALVLALGLVYLALPVFGNLVGRELDFFLEPLQAILLLVLLVPGVGVLGGLYPALVLSAFTPVGIFRPRGRFNLPGLFNIRNALACFQFMIAITLIIATLGVYYQLEHIRQQDPGYDSDKLFTVGINYQERQMLEPYFNAVRTLPGVLGVARSSRRPGPFGDRLIINGTYIREPGNTRTDWAGLMVDHDFHAVYGITLLAGRLFDPDRDLIIGINTPAEARENYRPRILINRKYSQTLGFADPEDAVGQFLINEGRRQDGEIQRTPVEIIGVVEDSRFESLRELPVNNVFLLNENYTTLTIKYADAVTGTIANELERVFKEIAPDSRFSGEFLVTVMADEYRQEENDGRLLLALAALSVFIAGMGLFALASYTVRKGIKDVGIRKVQGATSGSILRLYLWRFSFPVLAANLVAWPVSVFALLQWLQRFPDQIGYPQLVPVCLGAGGIALLIAWVTVAATATRAARANPVRSLRYE